MSLIVASFLFEEFKGRRFQLSLADDLRAIQPQEVESAPT